MTSAEKQVALDELARTITACRACRLCEQATHAVPGEGSPDATVLFIGEGPGKKEDELGRPFVGAAGKFLNTMLESIGWSRADVFIANVVKHRPPDNRDPASDEVAACWPYLEQQLAIIAPRLVVTLGRHSMARFLPGVRISDVHGQVQRRPDGLTILPLYHPAAALYSPAQRSVHLADFAKIPAILKKLSSTCQ